MDYLVLKDFSYAHDGIHISVMRAGTTCQIRGDVAGGLCKAGFIKTIGIASNEVVETGKVAYPYEPISGSDPSPSLTTEKRRGRPPKNRV